MAEPNRLRRRTGRPIFTGAGGAVTSTSAVIFRPSVKLDPSQVQDRRGTTQSASEKFGIALRGGIGTVRRNLGTMIGGRSRLDEARASLRAFSRPSGPFNPTARLVPGNSVVRAPGIQSNAVPRPGDLRSAAVSLSRGRLPEGSLLNDIVTAIRQPVIRAFGTSGGAHTAGLNIRSQVGLLGRQRLHAQRASNRRVTTDKFLYGPQQIARLTARRRGTPARGGLPTYRPGAR